MKIHYLILFIFLFSCSQIEFTLTEQKISNPLKNKTSLSVVDSPSTTFNEQLVFFFGENIENKYHLTATVSQNKTNRFVKKNQVATKIDYEINIKYKLINNFENCLVTEADETSRFSFIPKSSGYNFGSDRSLDNLYKDVFKNNIESFLDKIKNKKGSKGCSIEN